MALEILTWLVAIPMLGFATGLRSMTPIAALSWFVYAGQMSADWAHWIGYLSGAIVLTLCAIGELIADKMPWIPSRISPAPLIWRIVLAGFVGAYAGSAEQGPGLEGLLLGVLGVLLGAFGGYMLRRDLVPRLDCKDWHIALGEDIIAVGGTVYALRIISM
jgi:uncharacterized membrane protein